MSEYDSAVRVDKGSACADLYPRMFVSDQEPKCWDTLMLIVVLTVVPPDLRPETPTPHGVEHASIFLIADGNRSLSAAAGRHRLIYSFIVIVVTLVVRRLH
jgi:hypothetical protein